MSLGGGSWGTAVAHVIRSNGNPTLLWLRDKDIAAAITNERRNPRYLPDFPLAEGIETTDDDWCVAVQWHPEDTAGTDPVQQGLFDAFVAACR